MSNYVEGIRESYYGELVAEGFYRWLALGAPEGYQRAALSLIADVEGTTHRRLAPFATELGIQLSEEHRHRRTQRRIEQLGQFDWQVFIRKADREWPRYLDRFEEIERMAQARGETRLQFLVDHERALVDFVRLEIANPGSDDALVPMKTYVAMERPNRLAD